MSRPFSNHRHRRSHKQFRSNSYIRQLAGFSKFEENEVTSVFAYDYAMDSTDFCSNECWGNNATFVEGPFTSHELLAYRGDIDSVVGPENRLNRAERRFIRRQVGCIVYEDSQGFVYVDWYDDIRQLNKDWYQVQRKFYPKEYGDEVAESEEE